MHGFRILIRLVPKVDIRLAYKATTLNMAPNLKIYIYSLCNSIMGCWLEANQIDTNIHRYESGKDYVVA